VRVTCQRSETPRIGATSLATIAYLIATAFALSTCGGFVGEAYVNRRASLAARVVTSDGRNDVPCTATALLFGEEESRANLTAGSDLSMVVGMMTPAKAAAPVKASVALRVACEGYATTTTPAREVEVSALNPPRLDFGVVTVSGRQ
jgi:hypothetical protein